MGDPVEAQAVGSVFRNYRTAEDPVYMYVAFLLCRYGILTEKLQRICQVHNWSPGGCKRNCGCHKNGHRS